mgnify:CR=1 FL=1
MVVVVQRDATAQPCEALTDVPRHRAGVLDRVGHFVQQANRSGGVAAAQPPLGQVEASMRAGLVELEISGEHQRPLVGLIGGGIITRRSQQPAVKVERDGAEPGAQRSVARHRSVKSLHRVERIIKPS